MQDQLAEEEQEAEFHAQDGEPRHHQQDRDVFLEAEYARDEVRGQVNLLTRILLANNYEGLAQVHVVDGDGVHDREGDDQAAEAQDEHAIVEPDMFLYHQSDIEVDYHCGYAEGEEYGRRDLFSLLSVVYFTYCLHFHEYSR